MFHCSLYFLVLYLWIIYSMNCVYFGNNKKAWDKISINFPMLFVSLRKSFYFIGSMIFTMIVIIAFAITFTSLVFIV